MSLVIAMKDKDRVVMMTDSAETSGQYRTKISDERRYKIQIVGDVLVGSVGSVSSIVRLLSHPEWFDTKGEEFNKRFIVKNIIPKLYKELDDGNFIKKEKEKLPRAKAEFIMAYKDKIYMILDDFSVYENDSFAVKGYTDRLAFPYLINAKSDEDVKETMLEILRISSKLTSSIDAPYIYVDTVEKEYKIVEA